ncbi:MAG: tRNA pseudouridine38-40 synthase [Bacteroidia bacterium]
MSRYFIELSYNGTDFHGWQRQPNSVTVQETIEFELSKIYGEEIKIMGCGRTDAGVHAQQFFMHFDTEVEYKKQTLFRLNKMLPNAIALHRVFKVPNKLSTRFDAIERTYHFHISSQKDAFKHPFQYWSNRTYNMAAMNEAAMYLLGNQDFTSFCKSHAQNKTMMCTVSEAHWIEEQHELKFVITANRFLRNMVRAIVGSLLSVGLGRMSIEEFKNVIDAQDRRAAGASAPANGLFLHRITYDQSRWIELEP